MKNVVAYVRVSSQSQIENTYIVGHMVLASGTSPVQTPSICVP